MTITFENNNDVIVYALEKIISFARENQFIFVAQCVWWLASIIGLSQGLIVHIDNLRERENSALTNNGLELVHPERIQQIPLEKVESSTSRDFTEELRLDQVLASAEGVVQDSFRDRTILRQGQVNPLPTTKRQRRKAKKIERRQQGIRKQEAARNQRLRKPQATVVQNFSKE